MNCYMLCALLVRNILSTPNDVRQSPPAPAGRSSLQRLRYFRHVRRWLLFVAIQVVSLKARVGSIGMSRLPVVIGHYLSLGLPPVLMGIGK
jgi:hypothetical protein